MYITDHAVKLAHGIHNTVKRILLLKSTSLDRQTHTGWIRSHKLYG